MQSSLISRALLVVVVVTLGVGSLSCVSVDRQAREAALTSSLQELIPGGRVYPNDLAADREVQAVSAYLFDPELLVQDAHGRVLALDRKTLDPKWYYSGLPAVMEHPPAVTADSVVMLSGGMLYEVERRYGNQRGGAIRLAFVPSAGPAAAEGTAFVPCLAATEGYRTLVSVNLATGLEGWGIATRGSIAASPQVAGTSSRPMLYFATEGQRIFAYPAESAGKGAPEPSWSHRAHGRVTCSPTVYQDLLLVASEAGELWCLSRVTGVEYWVHYSGTPISTSPWASGDQVYFTNADGFFALDRATGAVKWSLDMPAQFVVRRSDAVYVRTEDGTVHAIDAGSGEVMRSAKFAKRAMFPANMMDEIFYMITPRGLVLAVDKPLE